MAELATLGIEAQAKGVDEASRSLDKLTGAAKRAENAVEGIGSSSSKAGQMAARSANEAATALNAEAVAANKAAGAMKLHAAAANQNVRVAGAASHNVANLAAQFQDVAVTAAMGMSPLQIALQQGTQLSSVLGPMGAAGAIRSLGAAFLSVLSPVSLVAIGITALAAAGLQAVNWAKLAAGAMTLLAAGLQTIAPYAVAAAAALALLYAPAVIGGIIGLIALLGRLTTQAVILATTFAAANPAIAFIAGITAAVAAANIFREELEQIFGRDIVADAKTAVNYIIGTFVGGFNGIRAVWSKLPAAIGDFVYSTANAVISGVQSMINAVAGVIDGFIAKINASMQSLPFGMGQSINIGSIGKFDLGQIQNPYANSMKNVGIDVAGAVSAAQGTDYVGGFGEAISRGASAASSKLKELAKDLTTVDEKSKKKAGGGGKTEAEKYSDIVDGANRRIASLKAEQQALGMTEQAALALKYETDLLNQAQQKGINLTAAQRAELAGLAQQMAATEIATKNAKEAMDFAKDATKSFLSDLRQGLANGEGFWASFGKAAGNVLDKIVNKIEDELVNALFSLNGASSGGGGGFLGGIFGAIGKIFGFASGGYTGNGAANKAAGIVHGGEYVFSAKATKRIGVGNLESMHKAAKGYASGGSVTPVRPAANSNRQQPVQVVVQTRNTIDKDGNITTYVENVSQGVARQEVTQAAPKIVQTATQQVMPTVARYNRDRAGADYRNS